jgi:glycosyltransferase involved in cell wall biosynthesis
MCGNDVIAEYVMAAGKRAVVTPTVVDTEVFAPRDEPRLDDAPVLGWVGSHSTYPYLQMLFPVLSELARKRRFRLKIIGSGRSSIEVQGVDVEAVEWSMDREVLDFQSFDIGLYPLIASRWAEAKSGLKAIQYMAVGIPFVATPLGAAGAVGVDGVTHLNASTSREWSNALLRLLDDHSLRREMGGAGREHAVKRYTIGVAGASMAQVLHEAANRGGCP